MPAFRVKFAQPQGAPVVREVRTDNSLNALRATGEWFTRTYPGFAFRPLQVDRWNVRTNRWDVRVTQRTIEINSAYTRAISHPGIDQDTRERVDAAYRAGDLDTLRAVYTKLTA